MAGIGAAVAMIATVGPVALAGASTVPSVAPAPMVAQLGPFAGAYQAGADAAIGGFNAGTDAAVGGFNAGAAALGVPFQFSVNTGGPLGALGLHTAGVAPVAP